MSLYRMLTVCAVIATVCRAETADLVVRKGPVTENTLIGANQQPEWTTYRRFPTTRIYVQQPPGAWGLEQWWRMDDSAGKNPRHRFSTELEVGIAPRTQLDIYLNTIRTREKTFYYNNLAVELRYALADWGKLPLNPTLYGEWKFSDPDMGPDALEAKLLLGDAINNWHYGVNLIFEQEVSDERTKEYAVSQALGYTIKDRAWSIGEEFKFVNETEKGGRGEAENKYSVGPSIQFRPTEDSHIDLVALFGLNDDTADLETFLVFGYSFGSSKSGGPRAPVSTVTD